MRTKKSDNHYALEGGFLRNFAAELRLICLKEYAGFEAQYLMFMAKNTQGAENQDNGRSMFGSRLGAIAATVGSAVGLGNIWRFPYEAGAHGGGAFLVMYVFFIILLGVPLMCAEFIVGRKARSNVTEAFRRLAPGKAWYLAGYLSLLAGMLIMGFYSVVAGWTVEYLWQSALGGLDFASQAEFHERFIEFSTNGWRPLLWTMIFLVLNFYILARGVTKGIEKMSNIMMPCLFLILVAFCIYACTMPGFTEGVKFFFKPDWKHFDSQTILGAMGQTFFSLSLGMGCIVTYGSYLPSNSRLGQTAGVTAALGTLVAFLAGLIIFPAVFTFGISPQAGPALIFEVLPLIFNQLPFGMLWAVLFFFLLLIASLSSTISVSEISIAFLSENHGMSRGRATFWTALATVVLAVPCALSFGPMKDVTVFGLNIFNLFDYSASNILMPVGGIIVSIFVGWVLNKKVIKDEMTDNGLTRFRLLPVFVFIFRWIAPAAILIVFLNATGLLPGV